jgi:hypothetical protein
MPAARKTEPPDNCKKENQQSPGLYDDHMPTEKTPLFKFLHRMGFVSAYNPHRKTIKSG